VISSGGFSAGIVGQLGGTSTIKKCYNNGYVKSSASIAGGIVGYIASSTTATIESCYHVGDLKDTAGKVGMIGFYNTGSSNPVTKVTVKNCRSTAAIKCAEITDNTALESYSGNGKRNKATMVTAAGGLGSSFMNDCEWINDGYPVLTWQNTTTLPKDLVLTTAAQLRLVAHMVNRGIDNFSGKTIRLGRDIDLDSREWTPIGGNGISDSSSSSFKGTFDGQGYSVSNLKISTGYYYVGFFGSVSGGTIRNFGINSGSVKGANKTGGLAGHASGTISNCYSRATVNGTTNAAGLVGMAGNIVIENCYTKADVTATGNAAGLVAYFPSNTVDTKITNSYAACTLNGQNNGGLVCSINASASGIVITNSYALSGPSLVYSTTGYTLKSSSSQSAANLKAKTATLGAAYIPDGYIAKNSGYPVLGVFTYKNENMQSLQPNTQGIYEIHTAQDLRSLAYMVNELDQNFSGKTVKLCADIDLESEEWIPIGGNASEDGKSVRQFAGTFEGDGHVIKNLSVSAGNYYVGFFGDLNGATVRNLGIDSGMVMGESKVAGLAGVIRSNVTITNCYNKASVCGKSSVGGMVGMSSGASNVIDSCYNAGSVGGNSSAGGILGYLSGSCTDTAVKNCYNSGVGNCGVIGSANATATGSMENCYTVDTLELVGTANALVVTNSKKLSAADLRGSAQTLGASFAEDYFTQNKLFPVLVWENGDRPTALPQVDGIYRIGTADQLRFLSYMVRKGDNFSGKTVELISDIDLENKLWLPIGGKDESANYYFRGTFEGNGHRIYNLYSWEKEFGYAGLFGYATGARIQNVGIESGIVLGYTRSAAFAACAQKGTVISSCYNKAMVFAESNTGAFVGMVSGQNAVIENCYNRGLIFARSRNTSSAGFVGYLASDAHNTKLVNCYNVGNVYALIGNVNAAVTDALVDNCYSVSTVRLVRVPEGLKTTNSAQVSGDTLRGYASVLGQAYLTDTLSINDGYPILVWENEEHCFHEYSVVSDGAETHSTVCTLCGDKITEPHIWDAGVISKAATCTEAGVKTFTCTVCKESRTEALSATGHSPVTDAAIAATCTTAGKTEGSHCSVCQAVIKAQTTIPATGHSYDNGTVTTQPTCTTAGVKTYACKVCKTTKTEAMAATGHTKVTVPGTPATCLNSGTSDYVYCSVCQFVISQSQTTPRLGHDYIYTDLGNGSHRGDCSRCDKTVTAVYSFTNGACVCGAKNALQDPSLKINHTLNLASDISVNFAVAKTLLVDFDLSTVYLECTMDTYEGNTKTGSTTVKLLPVDQGSYYYFTLTGLTAVQMNDRLSSVLYGSKKGQPYYSPTDSYSIADYAYSQLNKEGSTATLKTLCADLLRYGSAAQSFKSYRT
ncbi:MAG: hypothetical protein J6K89_09905, partial [Oscillospiraceae bacterium]|nr:hypothetical protein [Oscillospiraceae bacterium]